MSPVFRHGRLRLYLLKLLDEAPRHGYEVIRLLQDRFLGVYAPSPGTIYPRLARLEEEGLVTHDEVDGRKVYRITDKGREELGARLDDLAELEESITTSVRDIAREVTEDVRDTVRSLREELASVARDIHDRAGRPSPPHEGGRPAEGDARQAGRGAPPAGEHVSSAGGETTQEKPRGHRGEAGQGDATRGDAGRERPRRRQGEADGEEAGWEGPHPHRGDATEGDAGREGPHRHRGETGREDASREDAGREDASREDASGGDGGRRDAGHGEAVHGEAGEEKARRRWGETGRDWGDWAWGGRSGWGNWSWHGEYGPHGCVDPHAFGDMEKLARQFSRELRKAAWQAQAVSEDAVRDLRGILDEAIDRIRSEVFRGRGAPPRPDEPETGPTTDREDEPGS